MAVVTGAAGMSLRVGDAAAAPPIARGDIPVSTVLDAAPSAPVAAAAAVPASPPVSVEIPAIRVASALDPLRIAADGTLSVPEDAGRAGWWSEGVVPGAAGPAVIVGHVDSYDGPGVFLLLHRLQPLDEVVVHRADGTSVTFVVDAVHQFQKDDFPSELVYGATDAPTLRLITCGGTFDKRTRSYLDNVVVFAHAATASSS